MTHELKTWPAYFERLANGTKTFELRKNDRDFREGDLVTLKEWDPASEEFTGREISAKVTCLVEDLEEWGLMDGFCIMSLSLFGSKHI
jgi:hypothetical protein